MLKQICMLMLVVITIPVSTIYSQKYLNQYHFKSFPNPSMKQKTSHLDEVDLISSFMNLQYQSKQKIKGGINKIDSIIVNSASGSKNKLTFVYDQAGRIVSYKAASYLLDDSYFDGWQNSNTYDSLGNLVSVLTTSWDGKKWDNWTREDFTYSSEGKNILQLDQVWKDNEWENYFRVTTSYNSDENLETSITEDWVDSVWVNKSKTTSEYILDSLCSASLFQEWQNNKWEDKRFLYFEYDNENKSAFITAYDWDGITWNSLSRMTVNYYSSEFKITKVVEIWDNRNWVTDFRNIETYTEDNYLKRGVFEYYENGAWLLADGPIHLYNPDGFELHYLAHEMLVYYDGTTDVKDEKAINLSGYKLSQNYPNPFNPSTTINYQIPSNSFVTLKVYDVLGNEVAVLANEWQEAGSYSAQFTTSGKQLASGMYFYTFNSGKFTDTKKFILLK